MDEELEAAMRQSLESAAADQARRAAERRSPATEQARRAAEGRRLAAAPPRSAPGPAARADEVDLDEVVLASAVEATREEAQRVAEVAAASAVGALYIPSDVVSAPGWLAYLHGTLLAFSLRPGTRDVAAACKMWLDRVGADPARLPILAVNSFLETGAIEELVAAMQADEEALADAARAMSAAARRSRACGIARSHFSHSKRRRGG
jgi:hypothetical protein